MGIKIKTQHEFLKFGLHKRYLLAMSGGLDSSVLFYLMKNLKLNFAVAHANFGLREKESDDDMSFVKSLCEIHSIPFYWEKFDVPSYMDKHKVSLQMAARDLRYHWFYELMDEYHFDYLVTAHHFNDTMETFFINLLRGTGLKGLTGITHHNKVVRPMQNVHLNEIQHYAIENDIKWREDATNFEDYYLRNKIRHHIIPNLSEIDQEFELCFQKSIQNLKSDSELLTQFIQKTKHQLFQIQDDFVKISIRDLQEYESSTLIYHLFSHYGFKNVTEIEKLMKGNESAEIQSEDYRLIKDRDFLLLQKKKRKPLNVKRIDNLSEIHEPIHLRFKKTLTPPEDISKALDYTKLKFPLSLRIRQTGDRFHPSGMKGKSKKISKFFKDLKLSKIEKENLYILCDANNEIIGIPGLRWDERFIANKDTNTWLIIEKLD